MRRLTLGSFLLAMVVIAPHRATAAPPAAGITFRGATPTIAFVHEPRLTVVPGTTVYVARGDCPYDVFRYGVYWYAFDAGWWYRARSYRGPFAAVSARYIPSAIVNVPSSYWRQPQGGPPGWMKRRGDLTALATPQERGRRH